CQDVTDFSPGGQAHGSPQYPTWHPPDYGTAQSPNRRTTHVLGPLLREDSVAVPQLRPRLRTDGPKDVNSWRSPDRTGPGQRHGQRDGRASELAMLGRQSHNGAAYTQMTTVNDPYSPITNFHPIRYNAIRNTDCDNTDDLPSTFSKTSADVFESSQFHELSGAQKEHTIPLYQQRRGDGSHESEASGGLSSVSVAQRLRGLGLKVPDWEVFSGRTRKLPVSAPLHLKKNVVGMLQLDELPRLQSEEDLRTEMLEALQWLSHSKWYTEIERFPVRRNGTCRLTAEDIQIMLAAKKFDILDEEAQAMCNSFTVVESKEDGYRRRPISEPVINDAIAADIQLTKECQVKYTAKEDIRKAVAHEPSAIQFDMAAWFDQFTLAEDIRRFFGVKKGVCLRVLPMGFRPSCRVANAVTNVLQDIQMPHVLKASCVDNVIFFGKPDDLATAAQRFLKRCDSVSAVVKERDPAIATNYDFLGEHYCHIDKTRALTSKTRLKAEWLLDILCHQQRSFTTRQILAIFGLLLYAANTLRITHSHYHYAFRYLSQVAATPLMAKNIIPKDVKEQLISWARIASINQPVPVWTEKRKATLTLYTDASAWGWGAICFTEAGSYRQISRPWDPSDGNMQSSVKAEPMAVIKAVSYFVPNRCSAVVIYCDHMPLIWAFEKGWGKAFSYSHCISFLKAYESTQFELIHVAGELNPADSLSRGTPPLLSVTRIG
ncbi:hypothetical protein JST99_00170, partial [Candidatus Dependentiae bacterium]|nr:hypothetical protein [Candidatus Dependentiae bacterium]